MSRFLTIPVPEGEDGWETFVLAFTWLVVEKTGRDPGDTYLSTLQGLRDDGDLSIDAMEKSIELNSLAGLYD